MRRTVKARTTIGELIDPTRAGLENNLSRGRAAETLRMDHAGRKIATWPRA